MKAPKYIINNGQFIKGHVEMHMDFTKDNSNTVGGGWWQKDEKKKILWLYSKSIDFGRASLEEVQNAFENGRISKQLDEYQIRYTCMDTISNALFLEKWDIVREPITKTV
jgi:hypothetical protein